jgi:hypothetical protein
VGSDRGIRGPSGSQDDAEIHPVVSKNSNARLWQTSPTRQSSYGLANKLAILEPPRSDRRDRVTLVTANESSCITIVILEHAPKSLATRNMSNQCPDFRQWSNLAIAKALVISLVMVVFNELIDCPT